MSYTLYNTAQTVDELNGVALYRLPLDTLQDTEVNFTEMNARAADVSELRFVLLGEKAVLKLYYYGDESTPPYLYIHFGSYQGRWPWEKKVVLRKGFNEIEITYPNNIETLKERAKILNHPFSPEVIRVTLCNYCRFSELVGDTRKPTPDELPEKSAVFYGSSITYGADALTMPSCYTSLCSKILGIDVLNKGLAGACYLEPKIVDYIFSLDCDYQLVEVSTNFNISAQLEKFEQRVQNLLEAHERISPEKPLVLVNSYRCYKDTQSEEIIKKYLFAKNYRNISYLNGYELISLGDFGVDMVHPDTMGHINLAQNLSRELKRIWKI